MFEVVGVKQSYADCAEVWEGARTRHTNMHLSYLAACVNPAGNFWPVTTSNLYISVAVYAITNRLSIGDIRQILSGFRENGYAHHGLFWGLFRGSKLASNVSYTHSWRVIGF